jgi:antitoxin component of RelBE/YafQ-DinJ toxin-antitoxin module
MRRLDNQLLIRTDKTTKEFFTNYCKEKGITLHDLLLKIKELLNE